jgi:DNA-binding response OmpR family regulator
VLAIGRDLGESIALRGLSERARAEVVRADNGNDGLRAFYERRPDLVVLEIELPDADGLDVLRTIRALSDVPLLALTGREERKRIEALRAGADDCVSKPALEAELEARLEACCGAPARTTCARSSSPTSSSRSTGFATASRCSATRSP